MSESLYQIAAEIANVLEMFEASEDGEIPPDMEAAIDRLQLDINTKADAIAKWHSSLVARAAGLGVEVERLTKLAARTKARAEWAKSYLHQCLTLAGVKKLETDCHVLTVCKNGRPSISLLAGTEIPAEYRKEVLSISFDGTKAYEDWKAGTPLPEVVQVKEGTHLRIK